MKNEEELKEIAISNYSNNAAYSVDNFKKCFLIHAIDLIDSIKNLVNVTAENIKKDRGVK